MIPDASQDRPTPLGQAVEEILICLHSSAGVLHPDANSQGGLVDLSIASEQCKI